jgi:anti-sigma-K factor RskA
VDIKEYISSGILESYVLGNASEQERREVECLSSIYPELKKELDALSISLEKYAEANAVAPPSYLRDKIFAEINSLETKETQTGGKIISIQSGQKSSRPLNYWLAAASVALLAVSAVLFIQLSNKNSELASANKEKQNMDEKISKMSAESQVMHEQMAMLSNPENKKVVMKGTETHPGMLATVLWNNKNNEVYLSVSNLPQPPSDKQYQLWAIVAGKPVDMGVFDINADSSLFKKMGATIGAQAFAVTLETKGGSPVPTLTEMYVMGQI